MRFHLAQVTVARMRRGFDHPDSAGLAARVDEMNRLAEESAGFIWRLPGAEVKSGDLQQFAALFTPFDPALVFYTPSVWASAEDLHNYVYRTRHAEMLKASQAWIEPTSMPNLALWWIEENRRPTVAEPARRWRLLHEAGPTSDAFDFRHRFPEPVRPPA